MSIGCHVAFEALCFRYVSKSCCKACIWQGIVGVHVLETGKVYKITIKASELSSQLKGRTFAS